MTFDEWLQNELRNQPARILSWSNIWQAAHAQGRAEGVAVVDAARITKYADELLEALQEFHHAPNFGKIRAKQNLDNAEQRLGLVLAEYRAAVDAAKERGER